MANPSQVGEVRGGSTSTNPFETGTAPPSSPYSSEQQSSSQPSRSSESAASSLGSGLKDTAKTATDALRQQASQFAEEVGHELERTGEGQKARGVDALRRVARAIDSAAAELENQSPAVARSVHDAARKVDGISDNLSHRDIHELVDSAIQLARTQPALFIGGSVAVGFALARFLKSSSRHRSGRSAGSTYRSFDS
jgi:hypothetical protein